MENFVAAEPNKSSTSRPCSIQGNLSTISNLSESSELCHQSEYKRRRVIDDAKEGDGIPSSSKKQALKHNSVIDESLISADGKNSETDLNNNAEIDANDENNEQKRSLICGAITSPTQCQEICVKESEDIELEEEMDEKKEDIKPLTNKSFFSSERLSEFLQDLPSEQFKNAKDSCERNRLPPSLAAEIQSLKSQTRDDETDVEQNRGAFKHGLLIHAEHFGPDIKKWTEEGRALLHGNSNYEVLDAIEGCTSENINGELEVNTSNDPESVQSGQAGNEIGPVVGNQQEPAEDSKEPESMQTDEEELTEQNKLPNEAIGIMEDEENNPQSIDIEQPTCCEQNEDNILYDSDFDCVITGESLWASDSPRKKIYLARKRLERATMRSKPEPRIMPSRRRRSKDDAEASHLGSSRPYPRSRYNSSSSLPSTSMTMRRGFSNQAATEAKYNQRCSTGREYIKAVKSALQIFGISEDTAASMSVLALSADFLVPSACVFGRPHLVQVFLPDSPHDELCFLVGDVLRIKLLKVRCLLNDDYRKLFDKMLADCQKKINFIEYQDVRVRTDEGFQRIPDDWPETVFSLPRGFLVKPLLPLVPIPSLNLYNEITKFLTDPRYFNLHSWIEAVDAGAFASAAVSSVSELSVPPSAITIDPWKVQPSDFFCSIKAQFLQDFIGTKATERTSLILALPLAKEPLQLLTALLDPVLKNFAVACGPTYTLHFASMGFVCYLFYRLFVHFYIGRGNATPNEIAELRSKFRLIEEKGDDVFYKYDVFTQLHKMHNQAVFSLKTLTENTPKILMAGACLQANYLLNHDPDKYTEEDESRRLLYPSPDEARRDILELFKSQIRSAIIGLLESVNEANDFFTEMILRSLKMFYQPFNQGGDFVAHQLLGLGFETIQGLDSEEGFFKFKQSEDKMVAYEDVQVAIKHLIFKRNSLKLRSYNVINIIPKMARQVVFFRKALMHARRCLSENWWMAFHNKSADVSAKDSIVVLRQTLKKLFGIVEHWTRMMYNDIVRGTGEEMLNNIKLECGTLVQFLYNLEFKSLPILDPPPREYKMEEEGIESIVQLIMPQSVLPFLPPLSGEEPQNSVEPSPAVSPSSISSASFVWTITSPTISSRNPTSANLRTLNLIPTTSRPPVPKTTTNKNLIITSSNIAQNSGAHLRNNPPLNNFIVLKNASNVNTGLPRPFCPSILKSRRRPQPFVRMYNAAKIPAVPTGQTMNASSIAGVATATNSVASIMTTTSPSSSSSNSLGIRNLGGDLLVTKPEPPDASQQKNVVITVPQPRSPDPIERADENQPASHSMDRRELGRWNRMSKIFSHQPLATTSTSDSDPNNGGVM
ncbi:hypothetical protein ACTXT7_006845 [Hymenolepis weldensis]